MLPLKDMCPYIISPEDGLQESDCLAGIAAKHIGAIRWMKIHYIWVCTGDKDGECHIIVLSMDLKIVQMIGDGSQLYRTCDFIFKENEVIWVMDSPLKKSKVVALSRKYSSISIYQSVPGPAWYIVNKIRGRYLLSIAAEPEILL